MVTSRTLNLLKGRSSKRHYMTDSVRKMGRQVLYYVSSSLVQVYSYHTFGRMVFFFFYVGELP